MNRVASKSEALENDEGTNDKRNFKGQSTNSDPINAGGKVEAEEYSGCDRY
jgi:hypothetical protein